jgi:VAD1 Analog of StAR-related lipid transfer domain
MVFLDIQATSWTSDKTTGRKSRQVRMTISLNQPVGPKTAQISEDQVRLGSFFFKYRL